jgi:serine/threonine-protein kinase
MQPAAPEVSTCPKCGGALEKTPSGELGCMSCLLRAGIGSEEKTVHESNSGAPESGVRFGVYEIDCHADGSLCELGRGAMGVTYRATDTSLQRKVALKIIKTDIAERSADARERFMREARAAAALRHENIATIHQFGMRLETGQYFYAMELIEGETLEDRVRRAGPLDARSTIEIAQQVTSALAAAEKQGLVHRDLKPANLMLVSPSDKTSSNKGLLVKIIDFGLAKAIHTATDPKSLTHDRFVGTPAFASPEQFEHSALDVRSDIYSLGETLWFALTGKTPFSGRTMEEINRAQKSNVLPIEQLKTAHVPSRLRSLLESMLALEPASRPGTQELAARLQRCSPERRKARRMRIALAAAVIALAAVMGWNFWKSDVFRAAPEKSIAVLPFNNLSNEAENGYFADGVRDEILTDLARIADLKVISRTSTMQYKSGIVRNLRKIGQELGVAHLLEGSVQRVGNRVRVNAQLVDARTDEHLWAQTYDGDLTNIFGIQTDLAQKIAAALQAKLSSNEKARLRRTPTPNSDAYQLYVQARYYANRPDMFSDASLKAEALFEQAIKLDPNFALAFAGLSEMESWFYRFDPVPARREKARVNANEALRLQPDLPEGHLALGFCYYYGDRNYERALSEFEIAKRDLPNEVEAYMAIGSIQRRQGKWAESNANLEKSVALGPKDERALFNLALNYVAQRNFETADKIFDRTLVAEPHSLMSRVNKAGLAIAWKGDIASAENQLSLLPPRVDSDGFITCQRIWLLTLQRKFSDALTVVQQFGGNTLPYFSISSLSVTPCPKALLEGWLYLYRGDKIKAQVAFEHARPLVEELVRQVPDDPSRHMQLGAMFAAMGLKAAAINEGKKAIELFPESQDAFDGPQVTARLAQIYAWIGDYGEATRLIDHLLRIPSDLTVHLLKLDPVWDPLRGDPTFQKLCEEKQP